MLWVENLAMVRTRSVRNPGARGVARLGTALVAALLLCALAAGAAPRYEVARHETINRGLGPPPPEVARSSPAAAWHSFLALARGGKFDLAAHLLDLSDTPPPQQPAVGAERAEQLYKLLMVLKAREDAVTTEAETGPAIGGQVTNEVIAVRFDRSGISGEIRLRHTVGAMPYELAWLVSRETVASVPFWYRVLVKGEAPRGAEPLDIGLGPIPADVQRGTPREAVAGFLAACQAGRFGLASFYLDLGEFPPERQRAEGERLARRLMLTLQRTGWVDLEKLSNDPLGSPEVGVPENEQRMGVVKVGHQPVELLLAHRFDAELGHVWTVSQGTVAQIDRLYDAHGYGWLGDHAPAALFAVSLAELQLWQWLGILVGLLASWLVSRYLGRWVVRLLLHFARRTAMQWDDAVAWALDGPAGFLLWAAILLLVARWLGLTPAAWVVARYLCKLLALAGVGWFVVRLVDDGARRTRETAKERYLVGFLPVATRIVKALVVALVGLAALDVIGLNVVAGLGALGIGGVALAFAAQKTLENLFGTAAIAGDRPFEVGDFVAIGPDIGTVEDIGFRSTRLRTVARTRVTIPNGLIAAGRIENYTARDRILYNPVLTLVYSTTEAQLTAVIEGVKRLLGSHPKVYQGEYRVRFAAFGENALRVEVWSWIATRVYLEYTEVVEELNFAIAKIVREAGSDFAFPSRTVYMAAAEPAEAGAVGGSGRNGTVPGTNRPNGSG